MYIVVYISAVTAVIQSYMFVFYILFLKCSWILKVIYSRTLLFIHSMYKSLYWLTPISHSIPPPTPSPLATTSLFSKSVILFWFHG